MLITEAPGYSSKYSISTLLKSVLLLTILTNSKEKNAGYKTACTHTEVINTHSHFCWPKREEGGCYHCNHWKKKYQSYTDDFQIKILNGMDDITVNIFLGGKVKHKYIKIEALCTKFMHSSWGGGVPQSGWRPLAVQEPSGDV